jgi:hypothetical protein
MTDAYGRFMEAFGLGSKVETPDYILFLDWAHTSQMIVRRDNYPFAIHRAKAQIEDGAYRRYSGFERQTVGPALLYIDTLIQRLSVLREMGADRVLLRTCREYDSEHKTHYARLEIVPIGFEPGEDGLESYFEARIVLAGLSEEFYCPETDLPEYVKSAMNGDWHMDRWFQAADNICQEGTSCGKA